MKTLDCIKRNCHSLNSVDYSSRDFFCPWNSDFRIASFYLGLRTYKPWCLLPTHPARHVPCLDRIRGIEQNPCDNPN